MTMSLNIIQLNINGIVKKLNNISILNHKYDLILFCPQVTNFNDTQVPYLKNYKLYYSNRTAYDRTSGSVAILTRSDFPTTPVPI